MEGREENYSKYKLHYAWIVFGACFVMVFTVLGFCSSTKGLYLAAITEDMGIKRSLFSFNDSCRFVTTAIVNLFFGSLVIKLGPKKMILGGFVFLILANLIYSFSTSIFMFYPGGICLGLGCSWTTTSIVGYLVEKWFTSAKGTIMGIILAANGLGGALASQVLSPIIYGEAGWRASYRLTIVILLVVGTLVILLIREDPKDMGLAPLGDGTKGKKSRKELQKEAWEGISFAEAKTKGYFYIVLVCVFLTGFVMQSATGISSAHMKDIGISPAYVATVLSIHSLALAAAKVLTGISFDRYGLKKTTLVCYICALSAIIILGMLQPQWSVMAMAYGILSSFGLPLETIMLPLIALGIFGGKDFAKIMGIFVSVNTLGYAVGAPAVNAVYDFTGSYRTILAVLAVCMLGIMIVMQRTIGKIDREKAAQQVRESKNEH